ncbi:Flp family type IVb pilin [Bulleidia extructa]
MSIEEWKSEDGQAMAEYSLLIALLILVSLLAVSAVAQSIVNLYEVRIRPFLTKALSGH